MKLDKEQQQFFAPVHQLVQPENDQNTNSNTNTSNPAEHNSMKSGNSDSQSQSQNNDSQFAQSENNQTLILHSVAPPRSASTFAIPIVQTPLPVFRDTSVVEAQKHLKSPNEEDQSGQTTNQSPERPVYAPIWIAGSEDPGIDPTLLFIGRLSLLRQYFESKRPPEPIIWQQKPRMKCKVRRKHILEDSFSAFMKTNYQKLKLRLNVLFYGEDAFDYGGISREWFTLILPEITNPNYALFQGGGDVDKYIYHINSLSYVNQDHLQYFRFLGRVFAKALFEDFQVNTHFSHLIYKTLLDLPFLLSDLDPIDDDAYKSLIFIIQNISNKIYNIKKKLPQTISQKQFDVDVADGAITMNNEADAIRLQRFIHKPTQPGGKKWLEDEDEIGVIYGATLRAYSVLLGLLQACVPAPVIPFENPDTQIKIKQRNISLKIEQGLLMDSVIQARTELDNIQI
ncbi:MAG: putative E3 ubiquitin-protein ligase Itchy [Streblomastix strix]|uniref:HECT-type E3 ubiquitin transferase n=1 Tax=Streblomastix strix TaxID=222440 RepID=A0A5J4VPT0_9EUKA|nr:MAG: putative E3 ubiquitin-protein ligase Itchy [Streblomastix strix]